MRVPSWLQQGIRIYTNLLENIVFVLFAGLVVAGMLNIMSRSIPGFPIITWGEEVMLFLMVAIVFFVSALALRRGLHLGFDLLVERLPAGLRKLVLSMNYLLMIWFLITLTYASIPLVKSNMGQLSTALQLPMGYPFLALPIGSVLMTGECIAKLIRLWAPGGEAADGEKGVASTWDLF